MLVSRLLLFKDVRQPFVSKEDLLDRLSRFWRCDWLGLLEKSNASIPTGTGRRSGQTPEQAAERAHALVQLGEFSAVRQVLTSPGLAPGTPATLNELRNEARRPRHAYEDMPISPVVHEATPEPVSLKQKILRNNLQKARRGSAPGPSGITCEHLRIVLDDEIEFKLIASISRS